MKHCAAHIYKRYIHKSAFLTKLYISKLHSMYFIQFWTKSLNFYDHIHTHTHTPVTIAMLTWRLLVGTTVDLCTEPLPRATYQFYDCCYKMEHKSMDWTS